jgi:site-specific recombinase
MAAALVWLPALYRALRRAEGTQSGLAVAAVAGGALAAASGAMTALIQGTIAVRIDDLGATSVAVWWTMWLRSIGAIVLGLLVGIGVTGIVSLQRHLFARWFAVASVALALVSVVGAFTLGYAGVGVQTVAGIAVLLDSVWILLVSIFLWRDPSLAVTDRDRAEPPR